MRRRRLAALALALLLSAAAAEVALHVAPGLLPTSYTASFPGHGTEFRHPDVFERTPVEGVLLPHLARPHRGPPPADLVELGLAPDAADDARDFPVVVMPVDDLGFPNAGGREPCDLLLVGDSFGVAAGVLEPEGLQAGLARETGLAVVNLSLAGIGPSQERWLVETVGLPLRPRAVVWLWFGGNDLTESWQGMLARREGHATWADAWPERRKPTLVLPDLVRWMLRSPAARRFPAPLPGFRLGEREVWLLPENLAQLAWTRAEWEANPVWSPASAQLVAARDACAAAGSRLLVVYLPSKAEALLPHLAPDPALALRTLEAPADADADARWATLLANRRAQEELLAAFCAAESIPFLDATPTLEAQAARGELGYLAADTHWQARGQAALLPELLAFLRREGVVD